MPLFIIIVGLILIFINFFAIKKEKKDFRNVIMEQQTVHKDYDVELIAIRKDMAESILDLQKEILELRDKIKDLEKTQYVEEVHKVKVPVIKDDNVNVKSEKTEKIRAMVVEGYSDEDICKRLNIGKGELLLVKSLFN